MRDKRPVDELSIEELERILAIRKREARQQRLQRMQRDGRLVVNGDADVTPEAPEPEPALSAASAAAVPADAPTFTPAGKAAPSLERILNSEHVYNAVPVGADSAPLEPGSPDFEEAVDAPEVERSARRSKRKTRGVFDRVLLLVEVAAVMAMVFIGYSLFQAINDLERETASAQALADEQRRMTIPTLEPTPTLRLENFVLPGGHTPPTAPGGGQFNYAEIPSHLLPLVQSEWIEPVINRPAPTSETALSLIIPKLSINHTIVQGVDWEALKMGIGQLPNSTNPGDEVGNVVLAAHNDIYGELFRYLDQLAPGDEFQIQTQTQLFTYVVTELREVEPNDVYVMDQRGGATATLISCYPYQVNNKRIVVFAERVT
jgi:sortase A